MVEDLGVLNGPPSWGTGGGAGGVILRKFVDVTAGTAYTMTVAGVNGITTAFYDGGAVTAHNGAQGSVEIQVQFLVVYLLLHQVLVVEDGMLVPEEPV